jgi:opacity protein-like surface antigen
MKKIAIAITMALAAATSFADSASIEYQNVNGVKGAADSQIISTSIRRTFTDSVTGDFLLSTAQAENTNAVTSRFEVGATVTAPVSGNVKGYVRAALGERVVAANNFTYYSVEPGITMPVGILTAKVGYRYRSAVDSVNGDQTHTLRAGVSYPFTKNDNIGVRFDRVRGDNTQNITVVNYTRNF